MSDDGSREAGKPFENLPGQPTSLIGRQQELAALREAMLRDDVRLLTLTGAPGVGKTRLALAVAESLLGSFADGAFFVDLSPIGDATLVVPTIAQVLGVREAGNRPLLRSLEQQVEDRTLLMLLDNFEQVLDAGPQVAELLSHCGRLKLLVTSRAPLRLRWEHTFRVPLLALPNPARWQDLNYLARVPAVALFVARSRAANRAFVLGKQNGRTVAQISAAVDGLPLAIELAAAQVDVLPPEEILKGLQSRGLDLLETDAADAPGRHRTLRGCIGWSYQLLEPAEQQLYRRLAVFVGGAPREAAHAVCQAVDGPGIDVQRGLAALVRKGLVQVQEVAEGEHRFRMLEMIRAYGLEQLAATGECEVVGSAHAAYYLKLAEEAAPNLTGPRQQRWLALLDREHDNLRSALRWFRERGEVEQGLRLGSALYRFWRVRGHYSEGRQQLLELLAMADESIGADLNAKALSSVAELARLAGDNATGRTCHCQALDLFRSIGDKRGSAWSLLCLSALDFHGGDLGSSRALAEQAATLYRDTDDRSGLATCLGMLGQTLTMQGDYEQTVGAVQEGLSISREVGDLWAVALLLNVLSLSQTLSGRSVAARASCVEALGIARELEDHLRVAELLMIMALVSAAEGRHERAIRLAGSASAIRETIGAPYSEFTAMEYERRLTAARTALGPQASSTAWAAGRAMGAQQAIDHALASAEAADEAKVVGSNGQEKAIDTLSSREREIAVLLAEGLKNEEIAARLIVSRRTVENHVSNILDKLGMTSRSQVVAWVLAQGHSSPGYPLSAPKGPPPRLTPEA